MLCEQCGQKQATTHVKTNINGVVESHHLCSECAAKMGYHPMAGFASGFGLNDLFGSFFGESLAAHPRSADALRCPGCGASFDDIARTGKVGCAKCYDTFLDQLLPSLQRMHGKSKHAGKAPSGAPAAAKLENRLETLKRKLSEAVDAQEYEKAAALRDEIKSLEGQANDHD